MNNKAIVDDWRIKLLLPLLWLIDFLLKQKSIASALFGRVKERHVSLNVFNNPALTLLYDVYSLLGWNWNRKNLKDILLSVYGNKDAVDDELVEVIRSASLKHSANSVVQFSRDQYRRYFCFFKIIWHIQILQTMAGWCFLSKCCADNQRASWYRRCSRSVRVHGDRPART